MKKIILQDIDNVSYPFKEQHTKHLVEQKILDIEVANKFLKSKKAYLIDYLMQEKHIEETKNAINKIKEKYSERGKKIIQMLQEKKLYREHETQEDLEIEAYFFATFEDFFSSKHYQEGIVKEIIELNRDIKKENPETYIIGITARAAHSKTNLEKFKYLTNLTYSWNNKNNVGLDEIMFEHKKIRAYHEIKNKHKDKEILCFLEDDPKNVEDFLKEKVKCILIRFEYHNHENLVSRLQEEYKDLLYIAETPNDAKNKIKELMKN